MGDKVKTFVHEIKLGVFHCGFPGKNMTIIIDNFTEGLLGR